jgi:hypothetical protein
MITTQHIRMVRDSRKFARRKVVPNTMTAAVASLE